MHRFCLSIFLFLFLQTGFSQNIILKGVYNGVNLFVINPTFGNSFCTDSVYINENPGNYEIHSNAFEINFESMGIDSGSAVNVVIYHKEGCKPVVVNSEAISLQNNFSFKSFKVNRNGTVIVSISGDPGSEPMKLQQYRWGKWVNITDITEADSIKPNEYSVKVKYHNGENQFRVVRTSETGNDIFSKVVKIRSQNEELQILSSKVSDILKFSGETLYEIFDEKGNFMRDGYGSESMFLICREVNIL